MMFIPSLIPVIIVPFYVNGVVWKLLIRKLETSVYRLFFEEFELIFVRSVLLLW